MRPLRTAVRRVPGAAAGPTALGAASPAGVVAGAGSADVEAAAPAAAGRRAVDVLTQLRDGAGGHR